MKRRIIFIICSSILIIFFYIINTINIIKNAEYIYYSPKNKYLLISTKKEPIMSFGSGNREFRLYTHYFLFLGKIKFGEFPIEIENWDIDNKKIYIRIEKLDFFMSGTIKSWTDKNTHIGIFKLRYNIIDSYSLPFLQFNQ